MYGDICALPGDGDNHCLGTKIVPLRNGAGKIVRWLCWLCQRREMVGRVSRNNHRARGRLTERMIDKILSRQRERCAICSKALRFQGRLDFHLDHIRPVSKGGVNSLANLQALCPRCNSRKGDRFIEVKNENANA